MALFEDAVPEEIVCSEQIFDLSFRPYGEYLATGLIDGSVEVWKYGVGENVNQLMMREKVAKGSVRGVSFNSSGTSLYTISSDLMFRSVDSTGKTQFKFRAHDDAPNQMYLIDDNMIVTGDDSGSVKLWDLRTDCKNSAVCEWHVHEDFVASFTYDEERSTLLSVSGDCSLAAYDLRRPSVESVQKSDDQEAELHCVQIIKKGKKVVCGTQNGVILTFKWGQWGDCNDRYPGHPEDVDCMVKIDESTILTGSSDGYIRAIALHPNKIIGVIGNHEDFPVEGMRKNHDETLIGSFAHNRIIQFDDISIFLDDDDEEEESQDSVDMENSGGLKVSADMDEAEGMDEEGEGRWEEEEEEEEDNGKFSDDSDVDMDSDEEGGKKIQTQAQEFFSGL
jgi:WD repeat-containing protein 55